MSGQSDLKTFARELRQHMNKKPDWEGFARRILDMTHWPEPMYDLEFADIFDCAVEHKLVVPVKGGFNPDVNEDPYGDAEPGDPWYDFNYTDPQRKQRQQNEER